MRNRCLALALTGACTFAAACGDDAGGGGGAGGGDASGPTSTASSDAAPSSAANGEPATPALTFFVTSRGNGTGDFGGASGADAFCQALAEAVGSARTWRAYVSTADEDARDRIGSGPWTNAAEVVVAADVEALHAAGLAAAAALDEHGDRVPTVSPNNEHDILTGSNQDGTWSGEDCADWTSDRLADVATVGHADAPDPVAPEDNWNAAHLTTGCDAQQLVGTGGTGRLYCFAVD